MDGQVAGEARPLRERVALALGWRHDPAWRGVGTWIAPDGKMYQSPPELTTDFALGLLPVVRGEWFSWSLGNSRIDLTYVCTIRDYAREWRGTGATPTEAIALAWLDYTADLSARQAPTVQLDTSPKTE